MSINQFLRIFWARRLLILIATVSCFIGGVIVCAVVPPVWKASARVLIDVGKPDPVSGEASQNTRSGYVPTQAALATDYSVAGRVVDDLGMLSDPSLIAQYRSRPGSDKRDFKRFVEQLIIDGTKAQVLTDPTGASNILEISYQTNDPETAKKIADAISAAYIATALNLQRQSAQQNADWFEAQGLKAKSDLNAAIAAEMDYERSSGVVMANDKVDVDSARLQAMSGQGAVVPVPPTPVSSSGAATQLAQVDAEIATQSKELGPNNPVLQQLRAQRTSLASVVAKENANLQTLTGAVTGQPAAVARQVAEQKAKVVAQSDKIGKLTQYQAEVDLRRDVFNRTMARAALLREQALSVDAGLTPLASATVPKSPEFPKKILILPGSIVLGGAIGAGLALLLELLGLRVRGFEDLANQFDVPVLAVIVGPPTPDRTLGARRLLQRFGLPLGGRGAGA